MQRREFLKASCNICILGAAGFMLPQLTGCSPASSLAVYNTAVVDKQLRVPLSLFAKSPVQVVRPAGWYYDIAVEKNENNTYKALLMRCTHQDNQLTKTGNGFSCSLHGSQFDKNGNVRKGPAEDPLTQYHAYEKNDLLIIDIGKTS
ncbi:MAG TPA: Rieske (2Fe-2S) protein [Chitinophagaceae bacterium]|nr:Rieske (2Fe-2S) protein [Chitinophagaceae bacterium]